MQRVDGKKDTIICDLDGTISLDNGRAQLFLHQPHKADCLLGFMMPNSQTSAIGACTCGWKRDWDGYYGACDQDLPNGPVIELLGLYWEAGYIIRILTGRRESTRDVTTRWMARNAVPHHTLIMRKDRDYTDDHIMKPAWAEQYGWGPDVVEVVLEDRSRVVNAWRERGYTCFQVAPGTF